MRRKGEWVGQGDPIGGSGPRAPRAAASEVSVAAESVDELTAGARPIGSRQSAAHDADPRNVKGLGAHSAGSAAPLGGFELVTPSALARQLAMALALAIAQLAAIAWAMALLF